MDSCIHDFGSWVVGLRAWNVYHNNNRNNHRLPMTLHLCCRVQGSELIAQVWIQGLTSDFGSNRSVFPKEVPYARSSFSL